MDRSPGFGSTASNYFAHLRLAFASAPPNGLTLPLTVTRGLIMQKARSQPDPKIIGLLQLVGKRFQVLFHSPLGVLFAFPSRYWFTIGRQGVFSLGRWSSRIHAGFLVSRATQVPLGVLTILPTGLSPSLARLSRRFGYHLNFHIAVLQPQRACSLVWAFPSSLAATRGIEVSFSSLGT